MVSQRHPPARLLSQEEAKAKAPAPEGRNPKIFPHPPALPEKRLKGVPAFSVLRGGRPALPALCPRGPGRLEDSERAPVRARFGDPPDSARSGPQSSLSQKAGKGQGARDRANFTEQWALWTGTVLASGPTYLIYLLSF